MQPRRLLAANESIQTTPQDSQFTYSKVVRTVTGNEQMQERRAILASIVNIKRFLYVARILPSLWVPWPFENLPRDQEYSGSDTNYPAWCFANRENILVTNQHNFRRNQDLP